jgi:hypothetical protein
LDQHEGETTLANALKNVASFVKNSQYRSFYRSKEKEYGENLYRICDRKTNVGFYSYCYRKNDSEFTTTEKQTLKLTGLKIVGHVEDDFIDIESGQDNIVVIRAINAWSPTGYSVKSETNSRAMSDAEMI